MAHFAAVLPVTFPIHTPFIPSPYLSVSSRRQSTDDRISDLPESIIGHILSLLPTKNAVATSILSKRWKLLWTIAINLDFSFLKNYTGNIERFVEFVNYVLILHKPGYLKRFSLTLEKGCNPFYVNAWIRGAISRDVHELFVSVEINKLPSCMFTSERLQSLELNCSICITPQIGGVSLPRLESLKLISVYFQDVKAFYKLLSGCPILKYLVIKMDIGKMTDHGYINVNGGIPYNVDGSEFLCKISSAFLTHLELYVYDKYPYGLCRVRVQLDAPSLRYILLENLIHSIFIQQKSLAFLGEANIQISGPLYQDPIYCNCFVDAVSAFGSTKTLTLNDNFIRCLFCAPMKMSARFNRLTRLEVFIDWNHWSSLQHFIELSDNLQVFIVNKVRDYTNGVNLYNFNNTNWKNPDVIPRCLSNSLRTVSIGAFDGYPDELAMADYIIKHGSVLKIMRICFGESINNDFKRKYELVQQICAVTRKSPTCEVKFHDYGSEHDAL